VSDWPQLHSSQLHSSQPQVCLPLQKRVVVTGMGVVSPVGNELDTFFDSLCAGKSGISEIESFDCTGWPTRIAGEVKDFDHGDLITKKMARRLDRSIKFSLVAGKKALIDAGLPICFKECVSVLVLCARTVCQISTCASPTFSTSGAVWLFQYLLVPKVCLT
jgi:3-oxoacyl-(acyl-carrier-protein) synthase